MIKYTDEQQQIRLLFMRHLLEEWLKNASLIDDFKNHPNVAFTTHGSNTLIGWKCLRKQKTKNHVEFNQFLRDMKRELNMLIEVVRNKWANEFKRLEREETKIWRKYEKLSRKFQENRAEFSEFDRLETQNLWQTAMEIRAKERFIAAMLSSQIIQLRDIRRNKDGLIFDFVS